jgi:dTDP-4-amino-4,6-dideoxygalactose transaminase
MLERGIATGRYFAPLHRQPVVRDFRKAVIAGGAELQEGPDGEGGEDYKASSLPNAEFVADRVIQLPFFNELTQSEIREVCTALKDAIQQVQRRT